MKKLLIVLSLFAFVGCAGMSITPVVKINSSYFSNDQEQANFYDGILPGSFDKIFYACVDVLEAEGYPIETQSKSDGFIKAGPKQTMNGLYYVKCSIREESKGTYKLKWSFIINAGGGVMATSEGTADESTRTRFNQQWNYSVFCKLKGLDYKEKTPE